MYVMLFEMRAEMNACARLFALDWMWGPVEETVLAVCEGRFDDSTADVRASPSCNSEVEVSSRTHWTASDYNTHQAETTQTVWPCCPS